MMAYALQFGIDVRHSYFSDPAHLRLRLAADRPTAALLERLGFMLRLRSDGLRVYGPANGLDAAPAAEAAPILRFVAYAEDPAFACYTNGLTAFDAPPLVFGRTAPTRDKDGYWPMSPSTSPDSPPAISAFGRRRPDFVVEVPAFPGPPVAERLYLVSLASRATIWKYLLVGDWADDRPLIVDKASDAPISFADAFDGDSPPATEILADGRPAIAIRSQSPIPLSAAAARQFQLWSRTVAGEPDHVVIPRLPAPDPRSLSRPAAPSGGALVSEIFLQR
ncbi:MAG: hypothetical protein WA840_09615 [Caulobacteraceae bacterium]